jgi:Bacterial low temperature requirement A protein (LtrA)
MPRVARASPRRHGGMEQHVSTLELFCDLVFVFAITQVSHLLLHRLNWEGAGQSALVLLVVWWSWNCTKWVTNELDPESIVVRLSPRAFDASFDKGAVMTVAGSCGRQTATGSHTDRTTASRI